MFNQLMVLMASASRKISKLILFLFPNTPSNLHPILYDIVSSAHSTYDLRS